MCADPAHIIILYNFFNLSYELLFIMGLWIYNLNYEQKKTQGIINHFRNSFLTRFIVEILHFIPFSFAMA